LVLGRGLVPDRPIALAGKLADLVTEFVVVHDARQIEPAVANVWLEPLDAVLLGVAAGVERETMRLLRRKIVPTRLSHSCGSLFGQVTSPPPLRLALTESPTFRPNLGGELFYIVRVQGQGVAQDYAKANVLRIRVEHFSCLIFPEAFEKVAE
jgi:hypothetical protein